MNLSKLTPVLNHCRGTLVLIHLYFSIPQTLLLIICILYYCSTNDKHDPFIYNRCWRLRSPLLWGQGKSADEICSATGSLAPVPAPLAPLLATSRSIRQNFAVIL